MFHNKIAADAADLTPRQLLESQRDALKAAMTATSPDWACAQAWRMIARIEDRLRNYTDHALQVDAGWFGENGWAPAVQDIVSSLQWVPDAAVHIAHAALKAQLRAETMA